VPPGDETSAHYISCSSETGAVSIKSVSGQVTLNLCFCIRWDMWVTYCILVRPGAKHRRTIFHAHLGPVWNPQKGCQVTLRQTCVLHPVGSTGHIVHCGASASQNVDASFFLVGRDRYGFHKKHADTRMLNLCFYIWWDLRLT
jgi:hypothetical protein